MLLNRCSLLPLLVVLDKRGNLRLEDFMHDCSTRLQSLQMVFIHLSDAVPDPLHVIEMLLRLQVQIRLE